MNVYRIDFRKSSLRQLSALPTTIQKRIDDCLTALANNPRPHGVKKLKGCDNRWSVRVGAYRIVYEIHDDRLIVLVIAIDHRRDVYRNE